MLHNEDSDEDDFDGYFLKPVNEYNIVDKIKLANKELYETSGGGGELVSSPNNGQSVKRTRVTFRRILVDYEPDYSSYDEDDQNLNHIVETTTNNGNFGTTNSVEPFEKESDMDEIKEEIESESAPPAATDPDSTEATTGEESTENDGNGNSGGKSVVDEISEEISELCINVESEQEQSEVEEGDGDGDRDGDADGDEDADAESEKSTISATIRVEVDDGQKKNETENEKEDGEEKKSKPPSVAQINLIFKPFKIKPKELKKTKSSDSLKKAETTSFSIVNIRTCCKSKASQEANLPKYTGYFSEYGLSKRELVVRSKRLEVNRIRYVKEAIKRMEKKVKKSNETENAFATWLKNKLRCQKNRALNMYDINKKKFKKKKKVN